MLIRFFDERRAKRFLAIAWHVWRTATSSRPDCLRAGAQAGREGREGRIWRRVMEAFHGEAWRGQARDLPEEQWTAFLSDAAGSTAVLERAQ